MKVRIPGWARNEPVPGDLYRFLDKAASTATVKVNGQAVAAAPVNGYVTIARTWQAGDTIDIALPMDIRRIVSHDQVAANTNRVAIQRGPFVYAAEWPDNADGHVRNLVLPDTAALKSEFRPALLNGVTVVTGTATALAFDEQGRVTRKTQPFTAIPYYAWANRGRGEMMVWIPRTEAVASPTPFPTLAMLSKVTVSGQARRSPNMINDGEDPRNSADSAAYFDWWPLKSASETVDMTFPKATSVSEVAGLLVRRHRARGSARAGDVARSL